MFKSFKYALLGLAGLLALSTPVGVFGAGVSAGSARGAAAPRPMFAVVHRASSRTAIASAVNTWQFSYTYLGTTYKDTFVGTNPTTGATTTVPVYIIPIKLTYGTFVTNPNTRLSNGKTVVQNTTASPIFKKLTYIQGGTNVGSTQYVDAFQRASLWGTVSAHPTYHVLLGKPVIKPLQSLRVPAADGSVGNPFGTKLLIASINWFDPLAAGMISSLGIPAGALPIFVTTQTYLSNNSGLSGCCIGGYHNVSGAGQPYAMFTYIQTPGQFSQDVSALSHEIGEYVNDPFTNNINVPASCFTNLIYEVGDPLENEANYGDYPYALNGFTYHLQDLVTPVYFGAPGSTSVHGWSTFQGTSLLVCQNGG